MKPLPLPGGETSLSFKWLSDVEIMILFVITLNDLVLGRWPALRLHKTWKGFLPLCKLIRMLKSESTGGSMLVGCFCFFFLNSFLLFPQLSYHLFSSLARLALQNDFPRCVNRAGAKSFEQVLKLSPGISSA